MVRPVPQSDWNFEAPGLHFFFNRKHQSQFKDTGGLLDFFLRLPTLMRCFEERLAAAYRYVLVDSRTGSSDTGGICTTLLPEKLVAVFTPRAQSLTALLEIIRRAVGLSPPVTGPSSAGCLPSAFRIDTSGQDLRKSWLFGDASRDGHQAKFSAL